MGFLKRKLMENRKLKIKLKALYIMYTNGIIALGEYKDMAKKTLKN